MFLLEKCVRTLGTYFTNDEWIDSLWKKGHVKKNEKKKNEKEEKDDEGGRMQGQDKE